MHIHRMQATFGRLHQQTLDLSPGLNLIQAPNESGKSTWCAFLLAMAYGINSRERDKAGFIAEKNRYAPWSGTPMCGSIDCTHDGNSITITRDTKRATAPMANFTATYTGTGDAVGYLDGQTCGETLLGVGRDAYERSAFIRQAGLSVSQSPELERRIAALITTGDEDSAYSQVLDTLKQQRNRRRHNKTGLIPQYQAQITTLEQQLQGLQDLAAHYTNAEQALKQGQAQVAQLTHALSQWTIFDAQQANLALQAEKHVAQDAQATADALINGLTHDHIPENDVIARLRGAVVNWEFTRRQVDKAMAEKDDALRKAMATQTALGESPFSGQTPEQAHIAASTLPAVHNPRWILAPLLGLMAGGGTYPLCYRDPLPISSLILPFAVCLGVTGVVTAVLALHHKKKTKSITQTYLKRHGVDTPEDLTNLAQAYAALWNAQEEAAAASTAASARYNGLYETLSTNEQAILLDVRRFAPTAFDIPAADQALQQCGMRRKDAQLAQTKARDAMVRWQALSQDLPPTQTDMVSRPSVGKDTLQTQLEQAQQTVHTASHAMSQLAGQRAALGDQDALSATLAQTQAALSQAQSEYDALTVAMDAITHANTTLQNRFAPQLGKDTTKIFSRLTQGRYDGVVLDRDLHLATQADGDALYRDIALLSAGAADQLYLATRLAICDLILPPDCPIILDDALTNFDDQRCKIALAYLQEVAKTRQVLLFTCQGREAQLLEELQ